MSVRRHQSVRRCWFFHYVGTFFLISNRVAHDVALGVKVKVFQNRSDTTLSLERTVRELHWALLGAEQRNRVRNTFDFVLELGRRKATTGKRNGRFARLWSPRTIVFCAAGPFVSVIPEALTFRSLDDTPAADTEIGLSTPM
jgi:hypothetical protein